MTPKDLKRWNMLRATLDTQADECNNHTENAEIEARALAYEFTKTHPHEINPFIALEIALENLRKQLWEKMRGYSMHSAQVRDALVAATEQAARDYFPEIAAILYGAAN